MRFLGLGGSDKPSLRLVRAAGREDKVELAVKEREVCICTKGGQVLEALPLDGLAWLPCALPGAEHCLSLQAASGPPRELVLRAPSRGRVLDLLATLDAAAAQQLAQGSLSEVIRSQQQQRQQRWKSEEGAAGSEGTASDGPGPDDQDELMAGAVSERQGLHSRADGQQQLVGSPGGESVSLRGRGSEDSEGSCGSDRSEEDGGGGLPPAAPPLARSPTATATAGAALEAAAPGGGPLQVGAAALPPPPVRLLSFSGRQEERGRVASHVEQLERMVSELSREVAGSRGGTPKAQTGARRELLDEFLGSPPSSPAWGAPPTSDPLTRPLSAARLPCATPPASPALLASPAAVAAAAATLVLPSPAGCSPLRPSPRQQAGPAGDAPAAAAAGSSSANLSGTAARASQVQTLLDENAALARQAVELEAALGAARAQLDLAAADNVRLAQQAAVAVRELQAAAGAAEAGRGRERQLQASLEAAVRRCEEVGRELALLGGRLERRAAHGEELRRAVEELGKEKTVLTAALTTAQLQLRDATPAGFAAQAAELRRESEAAAAEAAAARDAAAVAERAAAGMQARLVESQKREAESADHIQQAAQLVEEARAARQAGLAREHALAAEAEALRTQLAGRTSAGDPLVPLQQKVEALLRERGELSAQVSELRRVGEQLSASCASLEANLAGALCDRDALAQQLGAAQQAQQGAAASWAAERAAMERQLAGQVQALQGSEGSAHSSRSQAQVLQAQLDAAQRELSDARQRSAAREAELQAELRLASARHESELRSLRERLEENGRAAAAAQGAAATQQAEREAAVQAARGEAEAAAAELRRLQEEIRRLRDEHAVASRGLTLEASTLRADNARLAGEAGQAQAALAALQGKLEAAQREAHQAQAQLAGAAAASVGLAQERKELQARVDRVEVERGRAARERDALGLKHAALQQQYRLLEAVAAEQQHALGCGVGCKENGPVAGGQLLQQGAFVVRVRARRAGAAPRVLRASASSSDC